MSDVVNRLREAFSIYGRCDFDTLKSMPDLRRDPSWVQECAASDAAAEIDRLRGQVSRLVALIRSIHGHCNDDRIDAALAGATDQPTAVLGSEPMTWQQAAMNAGCVWADSCPDTYYSMSPQQWFDWFLSCSLPPESAPPSPQPSTQHESLSGGNTGEPNACSGAEERGISGATGAGRLPDDNPESTGDSEERLSPVGQTKTPTPDESHRQPTSLDAQPSAAPCQYCDGSGYTMIGGDEAHLQTHVPCICTADNGAPAP